MNHNETIEDLAREMLDDETYKKYLTINRNNLSSSEIESVVVDTNSMLNRLTEKKINLLDAWEIIRLSRDLARWYLQYPTLFK